MEMPLLYISLENGTRKFEEPYKQFPTMKITLRIPDDLRKTRQSYCPAREENPCRFSNIKWRHYQFFKHYRQS